MILVDTSVWIDHLHHTEGALVALLEQNAVLMHPMILGEQACGNLKNWASLIGAWVPSATSTVTRVARPRSASCRAPSSSGSGQLRVASGTTTHLPGLSLIRPTFRALSSFAMRSRAVCGRSDTLSSPSISRDFAAEA